MKLFVCVFFFLFFWKCIEYKDVLDTMTNKSQHLSVSILGAFIFLVYNSLEWLQFGGLGLGNSVVDRHSGWKGSAIFSMCSSRFPSSEHLAEKEQSRGGWMREAFMDTHKRKKKNSEYSPAVPATLGLFVVVVQSLRCVQLFVIPRTAAHQDPLSCTVSWSLLKFMSIDSVMLSNHLILCCPLLFLPSIFSSIRVFPNELALHIRWPKCFSLCRHQSFCCRKGDPFQGPKLGSCLTLGDELSKETHVLTKQEILLGKGTRVESSRVREPRRTALPCGSQSRVLWWWD